MFVLYNKLSALKVKLTKLNREELSDLSGRVVEARSQIEQIQEALLSSDAVDGFSLRERDAARRCNMLARMEENMIRDKARVRWLELGDRNISFLFSTLKRRHNRNVLSSLTREDETVLSDPLEVKREIVRYFSDLFTASVHTDEDA